MGPTSVAASAEERVRPFPGDGLAGEALATWTHGVTIAGPPGAVWPWLVQMGAGRAGWYSWDALDNGGHASAEQLVPAWGRVAVGDLLPMAPGATDAFVVERLEPGRDLVLSARHAGRPGATWEFLLDPLPGGGTRLLVRVRVGARGWMAPPADATPGAARALALLRRLPRWPLLALARAGHRVMQARQLRQLRRRVEGRRPGLLGARNGMSIEGQGGRIALLAAPVAAAALAVHLLGPAWARLPLPARVAAPLGAALAAAGVLLWATAVAQVVPAFRRGRLVTTGAFRLCRNPIYAAVALLVLPGLSLWAGTWVYLPVAVAVAVAAHLFVRGEEEDLLRAFGDEYRRYAARVPRLVPFTRPGRGPG